MGLKEDLVGVLTPVGTLTDTVMAFLLAHAD